MLFSCAQYSAVSYYDEFDKYTWTRYENNFIEENYPGLTLQINPQIWSRDEENVYSIQVELLASDWIYVNAGKNMIFSIDGNKYELSGPGSSENRKRIDRGSIREIAWYPLDKELLYSLAFSKVVKIKILGDKEFIQAQFNNNNQTTFSEFYKNHVDDSVFDIPAYAEKEEKSKWFFKSLHEEKPNLSLEKFYSMLEINGWSGSIREFDWDYNLEEVVFIRNLDIIYELPSGLNNFYYPEFRIFEMVYESRDAIPQNDSKEFQIYPCANCPGKFPIENYGFLFDDIPLNDPVLFDNWMVLRTNDYVYLITGFPDNDHVGSLFGYLAQYFNAESMNDINILANNISDVHNAKMDLLESSMLVQEYLQKRGFYSGKLDGLFGISSIKSLQKYLKHKKFYNGEINGDVTEELKTSITDYQKYLSVPVTGWLNIEMAMNMK